tara:strand:- start:1456 stop:2265 length:810 start_codon:yes stop_codon:yes gene_type:complete
MFAQGQLLGMQTDLLNQLKDDINAWDKVAKKHPYSVYKRADYPSYVEKHRHDKFTTSFGNGLPYRVYDRNQRAKMMSEASAKMEQPYPLGYTGHVASTRFVLGQTYGRQVREALNDVADVNDGFHSTQELAFRSPDQEVDRCYDRASRGNPRPKTSDPNQQYATTSQLSYKPPTAASYRPPVWTERMTSNIGQLDTYGHFQESSIHLPTDRPATASAKLPPTNSGSRRPMTAEKPKAPPGPRGAGRDYSKVPAAGAMTRPDIWVAYKKR